MNLIIRSLILICCAALSLVAEAQTFPAKPIRIVVPYPSGALDVPIRLMQPYMEKDLGQPLVIELKPGASGFIGSEMVARATPDGYTLLAAASGTLVGAFLVAAKPPIDPVKDFVPIMSIYNAPGVVVARASLPIDSLRELIELAKRNPGKLSYGSSGIGGTQHIDAESFKYSAGLNLLHIPYNGQGPVVQAMLGEQIDLAVLGAGVALPLAKGKKIKLLATYGGDKARRPTQLSTLPDLSDLYSDFVHINAWTGFLGPAGLPKVLVDRLNVSAVKALRMSDVRGKIEESGVTTVGDIPEEFRATLRSDIEKMGKFIRTLRASGVKLE